jgi:hypothetical protein
MGYRTMRERSATVPYADPDRQREAVRLRVARSRERARAAADVTPAVTPPPAPPSPGDLVRAGEFLGLPRLPWEQYSAYHERLRARWRELLAVLGGE